MTNWERIGGYSYPMLRSGVVDLDNVPEWVRSKMWKLSMSAAASAGTCYEFKGGRCRYRIMSSGQGVLSSTFTAAGTVRN